MTWRLKVPVAHVEDMGSVHSTHLLVPSQSLVRESSAPF